LPTGAIAGFQLPIADCRLLSLALISRTGVEEKFKSAIGNWQSAMSPRYARLQPLMSTKVKDERRDRFETPSGIEFPADFNPSNTDPINYEEDLGSPGEFPYTRGIYRNMYRGRFWTMRQYAGYATAEQSNARYKYLLAHGTTGLSVAFDLPTQIGLDSDDPLAAGEVGKVGVAIDSLDDMERLFADIPLDQVSTSMTINATAAILLCLYLAVARKQGVAFEKVRGTLQNDILKEYIARGTYIYPPAPSLRLVTDIFAFCAQRGAELEYDFDQWLSYP
jgi:methylmalonyl-CoA mutase N-terminal domain/subunit